MADLRARIIITSDDQSRAGFDSARAGLSNLERQIQQVRNALVGALGVSLGIGLVRQLVDTADEFKNLESAIKLSTTSEQEFNRASTELFNISQRTGTGLRENVDLYRRVSGAIRDLGGDQTRAFNLIELIDKSIALSGVSAQTSAAGIQQFNQGLASGVLRGEEFNSVMENTPRLAQALADGLGATKGELRALAKEGKLTTDVVVKALESQAETLEREYSQVPDTVGRALVRVGNAWTAFLGKLDQGRGATASLAQGLNHIAENMQELVETGYALVKVLALAWAGKFLTNLSTATGLLINNTLATRQANAAALQLLQTEVRRAEVAVATSLNLIKEARLQRALAATEAQRVVAQRALDAAYAKHEANVAALAAQQALLNQTLRQGTAAALLFGNAVGFVNRALALLNRVFLVFLAYEIAKTVYDWLNSFEAFRKGVIAVAAVAEKLFIILSHFGSGRVFGRFWDEMQAKLDASEKKWRDQYLAVGKSMDEQTEKINEAAEQQKQAWQKVEDAVKNLTTVADDQFARQNAALQRRLTERLAAIDAGDAQELERDEQRAQAVAESAERELALAQQNADEKLRIIAASYDAQLASLDRTSVRAEALERDSTEKRKAIYADLAKYYAAVVDKLTAEHDREVQAARQAAETMKQIALQHQFELNDIERAGADEYEKIQSEAFEFEETLEAARAELNKGRAADQDQVNALIQRAHELTRDMLGAEISLAETDAEVSNARIDAADRLNRLYDEQQAALRTVQRAHEENAEILARKQQEALEKLNEVNAAMDRIADKLSREYRLQIDVNDEQVDAVIAKINSIPTEKTIVIKTVYEDGSPAPSGAANVQGLNSGGFPRRQGKLPGFGGGDRIPAMLEGGEFIVEKDSVLDLERQYGPGIMPAINRGQLPIFRADGGFASRWNHYLGGLGKSKGYSYTPVRIKTMEGIILDMINAVKKRWIDAEATLTKSREVAAAKLKAWQLLNNVNIGDALPRLAVPAPSSPSFAGRTVSPDAPAGGDIVTLRFQAPSGISSSGQFGRREAESLLRVFKEAGAVTG